MVNRRLTLVLAEELLVSRSLSRLQALILGIIVLGGLGLAGFGLFVVGSRAWSSADDFHLRAGFPSAQGVEVGTRVRVQGINAGEVVAIDQGADLNAPVIFRLRLEGKYRGRIPTDAVVQIVSEGMIGGRVLEIHGRPSRAGSVPAQPATEDTLLASEASAELPDLLAQASKTLKGVQDGEGSLGKLVRDPQLHDETVAALAQMNRTAASVQRSFDGIKKVPILGRYVEDAPLNVLFRPNCERNCQSFAEEELFEPGRAVLTAKGRQHLDALAPWLEGLKHKGSEVVVVSYADPTRHASADDAQVLTRCQSEAICNYLKDHHAAHKMGWVSRRKVTPLGQGLRKPPASTATETAAAARVEVLVFVPQG